MDRIKNYMREPVNGLTHFLGAVLAFGGLILLLDEAVTRGTFSHVVAYSIFGSSMVLLYGASSLYHSLHADEEIISLLQRIDHSMIYVLIAGTYTPICLIVLDDAVGWTFLAIVWSIALGGIIKKFLYPSLPHAFSVFLYFLMGWAGVLLFPTLLDKLPVAFLLWIGVGGLSYTVGAIIFGIQKPDPVPGWFGFHEIWHLFVMAGTSAHFWAIYHYLSTYGT